MKYRHISAQRFVILMLVINHFLRIRTPNHCYNL